MDSAVIITIVIVCLAAGALFAWFIRKLLFEKGHVTTAQFNELQERLHLANTAKVLAEDKAATLLNEKLEIKQALDTRLAEANHLAREMAQLQVRLQHQSELHQQQKDELGQMSEKLRKDFSLLANAILDEKTKAFNETQQKELGNLLEPLKTNLSEFKLQVERAYKTETEERVSLREQVKLMMTLNETLTKEAKSLTQALSGNTKKQGDWGERILESILEYSGLQKGIHYFPQGTAQDNEGNIIRPDILVKYPDNRAIIIDAKVSLVHYDQLCREEDTAAQAIHLKNMLQSLRNHIDGLSGKNYTDITNSLDMVIMFLPVEAAYITALQNEPELQQYAYKKSVLLISASNLVIAMKLVYDMWKKDIINKSAAAVADRAGKLYDKLAGFIDNFDRVGKAITTLQDAYGDARKQLTSGKGNIVSQAEQMKQLGIKAGKQMPSTYTNEAFTQDQLAEGSAEGNSDE